MKAPTSSDDIGDKTPHVNFSLNGKSALVTGAARGIGQAICAALAAAGAKTRVPTFLVTPSDTIFTTARGIVLLHVVK